jgi:competence protein ComEC
MCDMSGVVEIDSDVLVGQHHGADNACSVDFINAVSPEYVVFSAGHNARYRHPRMSTALRLINNHINQAHIYRTDWGDDEGEDEWDCGRVAGCVDHAGDDDVDVLIRADGGLVVDWEDPASHN